MRGIRFGLLGAVALSCACGGGGTGPSGAGATIGGTMNVGSFSVPAGKTVTVTSDLTMNATGDVTIAGTLLIAQGVNVSITTSGNVNVTGTVDAAPDEKGVREAAISQSVRGKTRDPSAGAYTVLMSGNNVNMGDLDLSHLVSTNITLLGHLVNFTTIKSGPGSTSTDAQLENGGTVTIITAGKVTGQSIVAGDGAAGVAGSLNTQSSPAVMTAGPGGDGGSVILQLSTQSASVTITSMTAGNGGKGGSCKYTASPAAATGAGAAGLSLDVTNGKGGSGGSIETGGATVQTTVAGAGGMPGDIQITAQNGGPGGNGASVTVAGFGIVTSGTGGGSVAPLGPPATIDVFSGFGGASADASHPGGNGGDIVLTGPAGGSQPLSGTNYQIALSPGSGGEGYSPGCGSNKPGTAGGRGGNVTTYGTAYTLGLKSNGGDGGSGDTATGAAGSAGTTDTPAGPIGTAGNAGQSCSLTTTLTAQFQISGGYMTSSATAGSTSSVTFVDEYGQNPATLSNVYCPDTINTPTFALVLKAGSQLMNGHYTSNLAQYQGRNGKTQTIPLTSSGALLYDTLIESATAVGLVTLPIDTISTLKFPSGVAVLVEGSWRKNIGAVDQLSFTGSGTPVKSVQSGQNQFTGSYTYTGEYSNVALHIQFGGNNQSTDYLNALGTGDEGQSPATVTGQWQNATTTSYPLALFTWIYND